MGVFQCLFGAPLNHILAEFPNGTTGMLVIPGLLKWWRAGYSTPSICQSADFNWVNIGYLTRPNESKLTAAHFAPQSSIQSSDNRDYYKHQMQPR